MRRFLLAMALLAVVASVTVYAPPSAIALAAPCIAQDEATLVACVAAASNSDTRIELVQSIELTSAPPLITNAALELVGNGHRIEGPSNGVIFDVNGSSVRLNDVTLTGADLAVRGTNEAFVVITNSAVVDNAQGVEWNASNNLLVENSTFSENGDGIGASSGTVTILQSTFARNGAAGIWAQTGAVTVVVQASIIAGNNPSGAGGIEGDCDTGGLGLGKWTFEDSMAGDASCGAIGPVAGLVDSLLPLQDAGCVYAQCTPVIPIGASSPARDVIPDCDYHLDQRGFPRGILCDVGAYEVVPCPGLTRSVDTGSELAHAIWCFNEQDPAGDHSVSLDRGVDVGPLPPFNRLGHTFELDGDGNSLLLTQMPIRVYSGTVSAVQLSIETDFGGPGSAILVDGPDSVGHISRSALDGTYLEAENGGLLDIVETSIRGAETAVIVDGARATVANTEIGTIGGFVAIAAFGTSKVVVVNSTVSTTPGGVAVFADDTSSVYVSYSTITDSGVGISSDPGSAVEIYGVVLVDNDVDCAVDGSFVLVDSFTASETCPGAQTLVGELDPLTDAGCDRPGFVTCPRYRPLVAPSAMIDAVDCAYGAATGFSAAGALVRGEVADDQRSSASVVRPAGNGCDAGASELQYEPGMCQGHPATIDLNFVLRTTGTSGDDVVLGTPNADTFDALAGSDLVCAGEGNDVVVGGEGDDFLYGEGGRDILRGNSGVDLIEGGPGPDRLLGGIDGDTIRGGDGNDYIGGFGGADTIEGGPGDETIFGGFGGDTIDGGDGNDRISGLIGDDTIAGGNGNDTIDGDRGGDRIDGGDGNDILRGGNADDVVNGGPGDDDVSGGRADDQLSGGDGIDTCAGNKENVADTADLTCEQRFGIP